MNSTCLTRRDFFKVSAAGAAVSLANWPTISSADTISKKKIPVALQLYPVRKECAKDLPGTLAAIARMGYQAVEFADYHGRTAAQLRKLLDDAGLKCCGTHITLDTMQGDELARTVEFSQTLGNRFLVIRSLSHELTTTRQGWLDAAKAADEIAGKLKPHGMRVGYHNHNIEFTPIEGELPLDLFLGHTRPEVFMQFDTGNGMSGGGDPVVFLKKYPGRAASMHIKPFSKSNPKAIIGDDELPWPEIFKLCETTGGTEWYVMEYEHDLYPPLESAQKSIEVMRRWGK